MKGLRPSYPPGLLLAIVTSALTGRRRSLLVDLARLADTLDPPLEVHWPEGVDLRQPFGAVLVVFNHYARPGVPVWWTVTALGGALVRIGLTQPEPRWVMTAEWRHWGILAPLSRWMLRRIAVLYGAFLMPPMPATDQEVIACATTVRQVIHWARSHPEARLCLAPEGHDSGDGHLMMPSPGVGRFMLHLCHAGMMILPAGVWEDGKAWQVRFGPMFTPVSDERSPDARGMWVCRRVMRAIAEQLPAHLRGEFGNRLDVS